jgi:capsular exopolysaccharide synthesis family protein
MNDHAAAKPMFADNSRKDALTELTLANIEEQGPDLADFWRMVKRQKRGILGIAFLSQLIGTLSAFALVPIYKAETTLQVDPLQPDIGLSGQRTETPLIALFYETQHEIIQSRSVVEHVLDKLNLVERYQTDPDKQGSNSTGEDKDPSNRLVQVLRSLDEWLNWRTWMTHDDKAVPDTLTLRNQLMDEIQRGLSISRGKESEIIKVSYESPDPKQAATIANAVAEAYIEFGLTSRLSGVRRNANWLNSQLEDLRAKIKESEAALQAYQRKVGIVDPANQEKLANERLSSLTAELLKVQTARIDAQIRSNQARSLQSNTKADAQSLGEVLNSPTVRTLSAEENKLARKVQELSERYGDKHPTMIAAKSDLREARRSLQKEIAKVVGSIRKEYDFAVTQEQEIRSLIETQKEEISKLADASFELALLERDVENNRELYESFLDKLKTADVAEKYDATNVRIVDTATIPTEPFKPNKPRMILLSGVLGLIFALLIALLRERLDNTFKITEHIEAKLGIPAFGIVPLMRKTDKADAFYRQIIDNPHSAFAENINYIRSALLFSNMDRPPQTLLITSATSGEGKTVLSINLAAAFSQLGPTLLLDVDLRRSNVATLLGIESQPGLAEVMTSQFTLDTAIRCVGKAEDRLFVLPCGSAPHNPLQLLSSQSFHAILDELRRDFAHIVMDAPPLLAVSDAIALGHLADSILLAIKAESTTYDMLGEALSRLSKSGVQATGAVLCQADIRRMSDYLSYYDVNYAKYYNYTSEQSDQPARPIDSAAKTASDRDAQVYPAQPVTSQHTARSARPVVHKVRKRGADRGVRSEST